MVTLYGSFFFGYCIVAIVGPYLQVMIRNFGYSYEVVGSLLSIYEIASIVGPLLIAAYIDRTQRMRSTLIISALVTSFSIMLLAYINHLAVIAFALITLAFFFRSIMPVLDSWANNQYDGNSRSYSYVRAFGSFGFVLISLFFAATGLPDSTRNSSIAMWGMGLSLVFLASILIWPRQAEDKTQQEKEKNTNNTGGPWFDQAFVIGMIIICLNRFALSAVNSFFSLYLVEVIKSHSISLMHAIASGSEIIAIIIAGRLLHKKKVLPVHLFGASSIALVVRLCLYAFVPTLTGAVIGQLLHSLCYGAFQPAGVYFVVRRVKRHRRTMGMTIYTSVGNGIPAVIGSLVGGVLIQRFGYANLFLSYAGFAIASLILSLFFLSTLSTPPLEEI